MAANHSSNFVPTGDTSSKVNGEGQQSTSCISPVGDRRLWQQKACYALANEADDLPGLMNKKAKHANWRNLCMSFVSRQRCMSCNDLQYYAGSITTSRSARELKCEFV